MRFCLWAAWPTGQPLRLAAQGSRHLLADAQQQHLIELIRQRETEAALEFAQTQLAEQGEESRECLTEMERTLALLAFDSPEESPFGDLLNRLQRQKVGSGRGGLGTAAPEPGHRGHVWFGARPASWPACLRYLDALPVCVETLRLQCLHTARPHRRCCAPAGSAPSAGVGPRGPLWSGPVPASPLLLDPWAWPGAQTVSNSLRVPHCERLRVCVKKQQASPLRPRALPGGPCRRRSACGPGVTGGFVF